MAKYLQGLRVLYTKVGENAPGGHLTVVDGGNADLNGGFGGNYTYLVPYWTTDKSKAASGLQLTLTKEADASLGEDLAKGTGGLFRYLQVSPPGGKVGIRKLALWRTSDANSKPGNRGWVNWTGNINFERGNDYLYICYDTVAL